MSEAKYLNNDIKKINTVIYELLSEKGKESYFPKKGILSQTKDAKKAKINATIGVALENDYSPMRLKSLSKRIDIEPENAFSYASSFGKSTLRQRWMERIYKKNPSLQPEISAPIVTNGLTHGLSTVGYLFIDEGDKIITSDKYWGNYKLIFEKRYNAEFDTFSLFSEDGFNILGLKEKLEKEGDKKIVLLNFPNNPTGYTPTNSEAKEIVGVIKDAAEKGKKILVIVDDAYFGLVYEEGIFTESLFSLLGEIHSNVLTVKVDGATKEDYAWGFRVGFITYSHLRDSAQLYHALENKTAGAIRGNISNVSNLTQSLIEKGIEENDYDLEKKRKFEILRERYKEVKNINEANEKYNEEFEAMPYNSGYFMCLELKNKSGEEVRQKLLNEYNTGVIAMGNILRVAFSSVKKEDLAELFENIYEACKK